MQVSFYKLPRDSYASRALRDDGVLVQMPGYDHVHDVPHDLAHLLIERAYVPTGGFWAAVAAGAMFGGWVVSGKLRYDAAIRAEEAQKSIAATGKNAEVLVRVLHDIAAGKVDQQWPAADRLLREQWRCGEVANRPFVEAEVRALCDEIRAAAARWSELAVGEGMSFDWPTRTKPKVRQRRARSRPR